MRKKNLPSPMVFRHEVIEFNPDWLDEKGWMTRIPTPHIAALGITDPTVTMLVGSRVVKERRGNVDKATICKFKIRKTNIWQELPDGRHLTYSDGEITITDNEDRVQEKWELIASNEDVEATSAWWVRTGQLKWSSTPIPVEAHPASTMRLFHSVNGYLKLLSTLLEVDYPHQGIYADTLDLFRSDAALENRQLALYKSAHPPMGTPPNTEEIALYMEARTLYQRSQTGHPCTVETLRDLKAKAVTVLQKAQRIAEISDAAH